MTYQQMLSVNRQKHFNSHPHEEDDLNSIARTLEKQIFQLTSSRRGWRRIRDLKFSIRTISTHILTKRMTTHKWSDAEAELHFNSHPHEEDDCTHQINDKSSNISTHILTKRMTMLLLRQPGPYLYFNSHPHEEDDDSSRRFAGMFWVFQLTSSRRGWHALSNISYFWTYFNSHLVLCQDLVQIKMRSSAC